MFIIIPKNAIKQRDEVKLAVAVSDYSIRVTSIDASTKKDIAHVSIM
jgi:hypothetical protein